MAAKKEYIHHHCPRPIPNICHLLISQCFYLINAPFAYNYLHILTRHDLNLNEKDLERRIVVIENPKLSLSGDECVFCILCDNGDIFFYVFTT